MSTIVADIYRFNEEAGLLGKGMDSFLETSMALEECIEGFEPVFNMPEDPKAPVVTARSWALGLLNQVKESMEARAIPMPIEVDELDKAIDLCILSFGKMFKMGLTPAQVEECFSIVNNANMTKVGCVTASDGKLTKPEDFKAPEVFLQKILDDRKES